MDKKVSIIMPVYNGEKFIKESIESVISQTYNNWELIIVNEFGSDDNSVSIIKEFQKKDERIILIQNSKREGISESLNIALRSATGKYIARMDSDDISMPKRIEKQVEFLEKNTDIGLCGIQPTFFGADFSWNVKFDTEYIKHAIFFYSPCVHPTIMFRREIVDKYNIFYNPEYRASEDYDFLAKVATVAKITNIDNPSLFKYRLHQTNATNVQNVSGLINYSQIMKRLFKEELDIEFTDEEIELLNCHIGFSNVEEKNVLKQYIKFDILLKKILMHSYYSKKYDVNVMFKVLKQRFEELKWNINVSGNRELIDYYLSVSIFNYENFSDKFEKKAIKNPKISVLLPVYNSENYILDSMLSIINQDFKDYELLILYEFGIKDQTLKYVNMIQDKRIRIIKNDKKLGLAESLNVGIKEAKGKYIARMDSDDLSTPDRLSKQYELLEKNENIDICSTWQKHFGPNYFWIHKSPYEDSKIKALLLFECVICHSTVMFRKDKFIENNLFYRSDIRQEDYELWCRASEYCNFAVIQEILGLYRLHENNITGQDLKVVSNSQTYIIKRNLEKLHIKPDKIKEETLIGFEYLYDDIPWLKDEAFKLFDLIRKQNNKYNIYDKDALEFSLDKRARWINKEVEEDRIEFAPKGSFVKSQIKKIFYPIYKKFKFRMIDIAQSAIDNNNSKINENLNNLENKNNNELNELKNKINILEEKLKEIYVEYNTYNKGEKIRLAFIMQGASFWPSFESVYEVLKYDSRFNFKLYVIDYIEKEYSQFVNCKEFLDKNNIKYEILTNEKIKDFNPHIAVIQTPYDKWHRPKEFYAKNIKKLGIRLVYIPYGIEFSDTEESTINQYGAEFFENLWRVYTLNSTTKERMCLFSKLTSKNVISIGSPKFDSIYEKRKTTNLKLIEKANGRKIVLLKIHFPKIFNDINEEKLFSPEVEIYIKLLKNIKKYENFYFVLMPHPKLFDNEQIKGIKDLKELIYNNNDIFVFEEEDYREPLYVADYFITDRSALSIEMAAFNKPILFLENADNKEKFVKCFEELFNTYEKGNCYEDIVSFLENCKNNIDSNKESRNEAFMKCIQNLDGKCGKRIVDHLYNSICEEIDE